jgi:hypothetical protein
LAFPKGPGFPHSLFCFRKLQQKELKQMLQALTQYSNI